MQKVIDQNYLREPNPQLHEYLKAGNNVVFTDYAGMESHKGNALTNLTRSLEIVSKYPGRVLVLKPTSDVIQLTRYGLANLPQALVDSQQTEGFPAYCNQLFMIRPNKLSRPLAYIEKLSREANEFFKERLTYAEMIVKSIEARAIELHPDHMKTLRTGALWGVDLLSVMIGQIVDITAIQMEKMGFRIEDPAIAKHNYLFRYTLAVYLLTVQWLSKGGYMDVPLSKFQNDIIDMTYVAYATYFDGVLSKDNKVNKTFSQAMTLLNAL